MNLSPHALLAPVDVARAALLRRLGAPGRVFLRDPSRRVALYGVIGVVLALLLTCAAPLHTFAIAPLALGIPHLLADVRYLVFRPKLHVDRPLLVAFAGIPLAVSAVSQNPAVGLSAVVVVAVLARGAFLRRAAVAGVACAAVLCAAHRPVAAALLLAHVHNAVGAVFVLAVFSRRRWLESIPIAVFVVVSIAILAGVFDPALVRPFALHEPRGADSLALTIDRLAPVADPLFAVRLVAVFVFAQGVHYVAWLRLVPELGRERPGVRSFASSARSLWRDLGGWVFAAAGIATIVLAVFALRRSLADARDLYLSMAAFHAPLELAALALVAVEGRSALAARKV